MNAEPVGHCPVEYVVHPGQLFLRDLELAGTLPPKEGPLLGVAALTRGQSRPDPFLLVRVLGQIQILEVEHDHVAGPEAGSVRVDGDLALGAVLLAELQVGVRLGAKVLLKS